MWIWTMRTVLAMSCAMGTTEALATAVVTFDNGPEGWIGRTVPVTIRRAGPCSLWGESAGIDLV